MLSHLVMTLKGIVVLSGAVLLFASLLREEDKRWINGGPLFIIVGLFVSGMWIHIVWLQYLAIMLVIPLFSRTRAEAAAIYAVTVISSPTLYYKVVFGSFYLMPCTKWLFAALGLAIAFATKPASAPRLRHRFDIPMLILLALSVARARDPNLTEMLRELVPVVTLVGLPYFLLSRCLNTAEDVRRLLLAMAMAGFVMAIVAVVEARLHWLLYKQVESSLGIQSMINAFSKMRGGVIRAPASFPEATSLGSYLALTGVALMGLRPSFRSTSRYYIALGILCVGLLSSSSRGALVGILIGAVAFDFYRARFGSLIGKLGLGACVYLVMMTLAQFSSYFDAMLGRGAVQTSTDYRILLLHRGLEEIGKHPLLGTTLKTALKNLEDIRQGEGIIDLVNGYISYGLILGYPGIIGLGLVFATSCLTMWTIRRKVAADEAVSGVAAVVFGVSAFTAVNAFYSGFGAEGSTTFYELLAIGSCLWGLSRSRVIQTGSPAPLARGVGRSGIRAIIEGDRATAEAGRGRTRLTTE